MSLKNSIPKTQKKQEIMSLKNFIPKEATQQKEFLKKYPKYDGRGIKIAIIDIDVVDTSLPGLQTTTEGLPKVIECFERISITVDTSKIVESNGRNYIIGLTGRRLVFPSKWKNPSEKWHLGSVTFGLLSNVTTEYKYDDTRFNKFQKNEKTIEDLMQWKDRIIDCIVWYDGKKWRACIDTSFLTTTKETWFSNLTDLKTLTNYNDNNYEFTNLINKWLYCINVLNNGNLLQIQCPHIDHASVVAHVAAAFYPDKSSESNGLAPGSQMYSMHTGWTDRKQLLKFFEKCIELKVDIINLSFNITLTASIAQIIKEMVEEHRIIITQSASNSGPLFSSIPEQYSKISDEIFIIGSFFTSEIKDILPSGYSGETADTINKYSSKGPFLSTGARGIDFVAPGEAITNLPKWYPNKNTDFNGTSLAAPNAAGSIACLLSALKANEISYSPAMIKMALANTAFLPKNANKLEFGNGIIQICDAFEFIKKSINFFPKNFIVPISVNDPKFEKGIIFVKSYEIQSKNYCVNIKPEFNTKWILKCTDQSFVSHCKTVSSKNNSFNVKIDANFLKEGSRNYAEIYGIDSLNPSVGPLFYLPITVICPANSSNEKIITIQPGTPFHYFIKKPSSDDFQQQCSIKITAINVKKESRITILCRQGKCLTKKRFISYPIWKGYTSSQFPEYILELNKKENTFSFTIDIKDFEEDFFEICIYTSSAIPTSYNLEICFQKTVL